MERAKVKSSTGNDYAVLGEFMDGGILCQRFDLASVIPPARKLGLLSVWRPRDSDAPCETLEYGGVDYERVEFTTK